MPRRQARRPTEAGQRLQGTTPTPPSRKAKPGRTQALRDDPSPVPTGKVTLAKGKGIPPRGGTRGRRRACPPGSPSGNPSPTIGADGASSGPSVARPSWAISEAFGCMRHAQAMWALTMAEVPVRCPCDGPGFWARWTWCAWCERAKPWCCGCGQKDVWGNVVPVCANCRRRHG